MSTMTPRGRSSSHRRTRCKCAGGAHRATPCCFNPLRSLFRCPGRGRSRSRHSRSRTPSRVRDASAAGIGAEHAQQGQEPSFFVYAMPADGSAGAENNNKKKKHRKPPCLPSMSIRACFLRKKNKKKERKAIAIARRQALTPAPSMVTHPPRSPPASEFTPAATPAVSQPPSPPAVPESGNVSNSPATPGRKLPATPQPTDSAWATFPPQQVDGLQIVELATGERLSAHGVGLIEMVGSDDDSAVSSMKSSLEFINEPPPPRSQQPAAVVKAREQPTLWLNGGAAKAGSTGARFAEPLVVAEANELWAHDIECSRAHADMLAETVSL
ncbi:hypothetical protein BRADI_1g64603v3, partial [Brachypodium distachyon]